MPILTIKLMEGRTQEQKRKLVDSVTRAVSDSVGVPIDRVRIHLLEMEKENYAIGGRLIADLDD